MNSAQPLISILIPVYNHFDLLERCLLSLRSQTFSDFEIIVVDDGSSSTASPHILDLQSHWGKLLWRRHRSNRGRAQARNTALAEARAEIVVFLDADMSVSDDFVQQHWDFHCFHGSGWIGQGKIIETDHLTNRPEPSFWTDASRAYFATGNVSVQRLILNQLKGFDESFSEYGWEDLELGLRLKKAGCSAAPVAALSYHYRSPQKNWSENVAKEKARGRGAAHFFAKHPDFDVRLMTQLTPLHSALDWLFRGGGLISETLWTQWILALQPTHPSLAEALYRALLNHYCLKSTHSEWRSLSRLNRD